MKNVDAQFSVYDEKIAYPIRIQYDEIDYSTIYAKPNQLVMEALEKCENRREYSYDISEI